VPWPSLRALPQGLPGRCGQALGPRLAGLRHASLALRLRQAHGPCRDRDERAQYAEEEEEEEGPRTETFFNLWQSILRGSGVITGCRRCADVCLVGEDYAQMLEDGLSTIAEDGQGKRQRLAEMIAAEAGGEAGEAYEAARHWIGDLAHPQRDVGS
jgi:hypothetical protein